MATPQDKLDREVRSRRTFAIISHPDAGKTTLTEKCLLYGGAIHVAGEVKARRAARHATSDWMKLEQERGISVSTSVMAFPYRGHHVNLLDTPGHQDFSEDTYRTLTAADSAVMLIDSARGVEPQTIKLFQVCRMRRIPILTFINKMDREGRDPLDLLSDIESVLGIPTSPVSWPIGAGRSFQGVYDRWAGRLLRFERDGEAGHKAHMSEVAIDDPALEEAIGGHARARLAEELEMLDVAGNPFDREAFLRGELTPVFFGSALTSFGVEPFLDRFVDLAPSPRPRETDEGEVPPTVPAFSGFVFKIQANMDPQHRDRIAFMRVCSGRFERGMKVTHLRTGKPLTLSRSVQFLAQARASVEDAYAGDIVGLWDPGVLRIGDTLSDDASSATFAGIPRFSPEHFVRVRLADPLKRKQLKKGLDQLSEEGAVQVFYDRVRLERDPVLGAVGVLQFDVIKYRLKSEYNVEAIYDGLPFRFARWLEGEDFDADAFEKKTRTPVVVDAEGRPLALFENQWTLDRIVRENDDVRFVAAVQPGRAKR